MARVERTVVFIGRTGAGKSACANALAGAPLFPESSFSSSETKYVESRTVVVDWEMRQYRVKIVDTIGIGDTDLGHDEVLKRLAQACYECREGINAVFFVTGGRFTAEEADAWDIMWKVLFNATVIDYITIVRSRFPQFLNSSLLQTDCEQLKAQKGAAKRIMPNVKRIIYVDNPSSDYAGWEETRQKSRGVVMTHLSQCDSVFKPPELDEVNERISGHVEEKIASDGRIKALTEELGTAREQMEEVQVELRRQVAEERQKAAETELRLVREMNELLHERSSVQERQQSRRDVSGDRS